VERLFSVTYERHLLSLSMMAGPRHARERRLVMVDSTKLGSPNLIHHSSGLRQVDRPPRHKLVRNPVDRLTGPRRKAQVPAVPTWDTIKSLLTAV